MVAFSGDSEASRERRGNGTTAAAALWLCWSLQRRDETGTLVPGGRSRVSLGTVIDGLSFPIPERHPKATRCVQGHTQFRTVFRPGLPLAVHVARVRSLAHPKEDTPHRAKPAE